MTQKLHEKGQEGVQEEMDITETEVVAVEGRRGRPQRDLVLPISIVAAAVMVAAALVFATLYKGGGTQNGAGANDLAAGGATSTPSAAALAPLGARDAILGSANAPVTVVEYGDYQCPFCAQYFQTVEPQIIQNYVNTGKVKMVFRDFPFLGPESLAAANAAQCAEDQNKLWAYHDALYTAKIGNDSQGGGENDGFFNRALFMKIAGQLGLNTSTFGTCLDGNSEANYVSQEKSAAVAAGVDSTPATFVNGVMVTDQTGANVGANGQAVLQAIANAVAAAK